MKLLSALKRPALSSVGPSTERPDSERLQAERADQAAKRRVRDEARATLERLEGVIAASNVAARTAASAVREANDFRNAWVRGGCKHSESRELQRLDEDAAAATDTAKRCQRDADAVRKGLSEAEHAVRSAQSALQECQTRIRAAVDMQFVEEKMPVFDRRIRLIEELQSLDVDIRGLEDFVSTQEALSRITAERARARLQPIPDYVVTNAGSVVSKPPDQVLALTEEYRKRAEPMLRDPDAA